MKLLKSWKSVLLLSTALFLVDYFTKALVSEKLPFGRASEVPIFSFAGIDCSITHAINTGAAWGAFGNFPDLLIIVRIILIALLIGYMVFSKLQGRFRLPLSLIVAGAIGNVCDYFIYGHVIDMIHFQFWGYSYPVFNVADSMICIGTIVTLALSLYHDHPENA